MKKVICLMVAVLLCIGLTSFAVAADSEFVPSISYKGAPSIEETEDENGDPVIGTITDATGKEIDYLREGDLLVTPIAEANTSTKLPADAKETLLSVYEQLNKGTMELPYGKDVDADKMVIKDLFDVSWVDGDKAETVTPTGVTVTITFDIGVAANTDVVVMTYINNVWQEIVSVKNNGDGTITCVFEEFCPVAISVPTPDQGGSSETGDKSNVTLWAVLLVASAAAVVVLVILRRRDFLK